MWPGQLRAFSDELVKLSEFARGLPSKKRVTALPEVASTTPWEFGVHDHHARKAGRHFDLRLGDPITGIAHSWAVPKARLPQPGERPLLAIRQPDHTMKYMDFKGVLRRGYGRGKVDLHARGKAEVHKVNKDRVKFTQGGQDYLLIRTHADKWLFRNVSEKR